MNWDLIPSSVFVISDALAWEKILQILRKIIPPRDWKLPQNFLKIQLKLKKISLNKYLYSVPS